MKAIDNVPLAFRTQHSRRPPPIRPISNVRGTRLRSPSSARQLYYTESRAWKQIYGHDGTGGIQDDPIEYSFPVNGLSRIRAAEQHTHGRYHRLLSHSSSKKGLPQMRPHMQYYVNLVIERLKDKS